MAVRFGFATSVMAAVFSAAAWAGPWAEVGDAQSRSDVELAAAYGLVNNFTMQWPMPWTGILGQLQDDKAIDLLPPEVREAADRLLVKGRDEVHVGRASAEINVDVASDPAVIRGFDGLGRSKSQGQVAYEYLSSETAVRLAVGAQQSSRHDRQMLVLDSSYIATRIDGMVAYAGYVPHWWGPGWISAMSVSNNARPIPQIGISRVHSQESSAWWANWLGPWQFEAFVGVMDGPRVARNTALVGLHFVFNPVPGLEIGLSRLTELCGSGHSCTFMDYFSLLNDPKHINTTNDQGGIELRYTGVALSRPFSVYAQFMNEDTNPFVHSVTSKLVGGTVWLPVAGLTGRLTLEYATSVPTIDIWGGELAHGSAYNNYDYVDGMRYRDRTLGFSLDSDSVLYSAQASLVDTAQRTWTLTYHRALVSNPLNTWGNVVTPVAVRFNAVEARLSVPLRWSLYHTRIEAVGRWQDDQPRPRVGSQVAGELVLKFGI